MTASRGGARRSLVVLSPIAPAESGNGLAMRVASFVGAASETYEVRVAVVPVSGQLDGEHPYETAPVFQVRPPPPPELRREQAELLSDRRWRGLLGALEPLEQRARLAPAALAREVLRASGAPAGSAVHVVRSYMAPLGLRVAELLGARFAALDLDDDDESMHEGEEEKASAYHRLVAVFAPLYSAVFLASQPDARRVALRHGISTTVLPNVVRVPPRQERRQPIPGRILFVGNLTYEPNVEAAVELVRGVLPAMRAATGQALTVELVGRYDATGPLASLASTPSVLLRGFVEEVSACYASASVVVAPLRRGSGTRLKLLEAFAEGVPVVTTPLGAAGLDVGHEHQLLLASSPEELAREAVRGLEDEALSSRLAASAFEFVSRQHSATTLLRDLPGLLALAERRGLLPSAPVDAGGRALQ